MLADFPRDVVLEAKSLTYSERKERLICTYPGCTNPGDGGECPEHLAKSKRRKRQWKRRRARADRARQRAEKKAAEIRARKKLCKSCNAKRLLGQEYCATHLIAVGDAGKALVDKTVDKKARIEAATSIDRDGRSRYRGQARRGRQSVAQLDDQDLRFALDAMQKAKDGLAFIAEQAPGMSKLERKQAIDAALGHALHSSRLVDDVLARHGFFGKVDPDEDRGGR